MSLGATTVPPLNIPESLSTVNVRIIDTTSRLENLPSKSFVKPTYKSFETLSIPSYAFLIEHPNLKRKVVWDLGIREDWEKLAPTIVNRVKQGGWKLDIERGVGEILKANSVDLKGIEAIIWR